MKPFLVVVVALAACGKSSPAPATDAPATPTDTAPTDASPTTLSITGQLEAAEAAGTIDHDTFLLYSLYAAMAPDLLPAPFTLAPGEPLPEGTAAAGEAVGRLPQMTADLQAKFAPLLVRPTDATSVFAAAARFDHHERTWMKVVDDQDRIVFWYDDPAYASKVSAEAAHVENASVFARYQLVMGNTPCGDGNDADVPSTDPTESYLDIYYTSTHYLRGQNVTTTALAVTLPSNKSSRSGLPAGCQAPFIVIPVAPAPAAAPVSDSNSRTILRHELFHVFQESEAVALTPANQWALESTAEWASDLTSHDRQWVVDQSPDANPPWSFSSTVGPLTANTDLAQYRSALFWAFAVEDHGTPEAAVGSMFAEMASGSSSVKAADDAIGLSNVFSEFALDLWNKDPVGKVIAVDGQTFPNLMNSFTKDTMLADGQVLDLDLATLPHVSARFYRVKLASDVKQLAVDLDGMGAFRRVRGVATYSDGTARKFDWGESGQQQYCLDKPGQNIAEVVFAIADVDPNVDEPVAAGKLHFEAKPACDQVPSTLTYNSTTNVSLAPAFSFTSGTGSVSASYGMTAALTVTFKQKIQSGSEVDYLYDVTGTNHISLTGMAQANFTSTINGMFIESYMASESASGDGTCHTPSAAGEPLFGQGAATTGQLLVKVTATGATWSLGYDMVGVPLNYSYSLTHAKSCTGGTDTITQTYDAGAMRLHDHEVDSCQGGSNSDADESTQHAHVKWTHGDVSPLFGGTLDPATGTISASSGATITTCSSVPFANTPAYFTYGAPVMQAPTCNFTDTGSLHIELGPLAGP